jgi:hypothetical protein
MLYGWLLRHVHRCIEQKWDGKVVMNGEWISIWNKAIVVYFQTVVRYSLFELEKNQE